MFAEVIRLTIYGIIFLSLVLIDYNLGNGAVDMFQKIFCKFLCFVKHTIRNEAKQDVMLEKIENPVKLPVLLIEIMLLSLTIAFLKKHQQIGGKHGRIDDLLQESKEALRQTNEFLEKWRMRRVIREEDERRRLSGLPIYDINWQASTETPYLDDEPQEITPLKLELPILHMAIIDTRGQARNQPERGDAGDSVNFTDSTLVSVTSLLDDDLESSLTKPNSDEKVTDDKLSADAYNRQLWDVMEEDSNVED